MTASARPDNGQEQLEGNSTNKDRRVAYWSDLYYRVFAHLLFDSVYFEAVKASGFEETPKNKWMKGEICVPGGLTEQQRSQWVSDYRSLVLWVLNGMPASARLPTRLVDEEPTSEQASTFDGTSDRQPATCAKLPESANDFLRRENNQLYSANKKLSTENTALEKRFASITIMSKASAAQLASVLPHDIVENLDDALQNLQASLDMMLQQHSGKGWFFACASRDVGKGMLASNYLQIVFRRRRKEGRRRSDGSHRCAVSSDQQGQQFERRPSAADKERSRAAGRRPSAAEERKPQEGKAL